MRLPLLLALLVAGSVAAQPRRPGVSLGNTKDDEEPKKAALAPARPDVGLLRGLIFATEPNPMEVRIQAIEDLGLLGDPRALNVLAQMIFDPCLKPDRRTSSALRGPSPASPDCTWTFPGTIGAAWTGSG